MANNNRRNIDDSFVDYGDVESSWFVNDAGPIYGGKVGLMANIHTSLNYPDQRITVGLISPDRKACPTIAASMTVSEAVHLINMLLAAITEVAAAVPSLTADAPQIVQPPVFAR